MNEKNKVENCRIEPKLKLINMDSVEVEQIEWLLYPFIPYGKVTIIQGDPGEGKTTMVLQIIAKLTRGEPIFPVTDTTMKIKEKRSDEVDSGNDGLDGEDNMQEQSSMSPVHVIYQTDHLLLSDNEYVRRYHFVEGLARDWKGVEIQENTVTKKFKSYPTPFSTRKGAADAFDKLFKKFSDSILIVSYSSNSQPTQDEMVALMSKYKEHVEVVPIDYTYSFGNQKHAKTNRNKVQEYLFVGFNGEDVWQKQKLQLKK